jgi:F-type H+-transporting ATPase subunit delta
MAELSTLARPYARAAFEYAQAQGDLAGWEAMLTQAAAVAQSEAVVKLITSPSLSSEAIAKQFIELLGEELSDKGQNFVSTLAGNKRLLLLPEIAALFSLMKANIEKAVDVEVTSAFDLDSDITVTLEKALAKNLERNVRISTQTDKSLIGGVVIRAGDTIIDGSVRGRIAKLAEAMKS